MCWFTAYAIRELACRWEAEAAASRGPGILVRGSSSHCLYPCLCRFRGRCQGDAEDLSFSPTPIHPGQRRPHSNGRTDAVTAETSWQTLPRREAVLWTVLGRSGILDEWPTASPGSCGPLMGSASPPANPLP